MKYKSPIDENAIVIGDFIAREAIKMYKIEFQIVCYLLNLKHIIFILFLVKKTINVTTIIDIKDYYLLANVMQLCIVRKLILKYEKKTMKIYVISYLLIDFKPLLGHCLFLPSIVVKVLYFVNLYMTLSSIM